MFVAPIEPYIVLVTTSSTDTRFSFYNTIAFPINCLSLIPIQSDHDIFLIPIIYQYHPKNNS